MEGNLTRGPILKTLTKLAIPIMASSFLGTLYNITDMAWIGLLGAKAVAGVGVGGMFTWLSLEYVEKICKIGIPTALQGMAYCFISMILTRMVAGFGPEAIATQRVGALSGLGRTRLCSVISIAFTSLRIPLAIILSSSVLGILGIWWALTTTTMMKGMIFTCVFLLIVRKMTDAQRNL